MDPSSKDYVAIVQCHIVKQRCAGYFCEQALQRREGGFADYPADRVYRHVMIDCGGCCGRGLQRKLANLVHQLEKQEGITRDRVAVQLSSCITKDSHHGPPCPHLDYLTTLIERMGLEWAEDTRISRLSESRRDGKTYLGAE